MKKKKLAPVHPGEVLLAEFLEPMGMTSGELARAIHVPVKRINEVIQGKRSVSADVALRLGRYFRNSPQFWLGLQMDYDLDVTSDLVEDVIAKEIHPRSAVG